MGVIANDSTAKAEEAGASSAFAMPANLPTKQAMPQLETSDSSADDESVSSSDALMKELEDHAHTHRVLMSSDAMRYLIRKNGGEANVLSLLDKVMNKAKSDYPSEDDWLVINLSRMQEIFARMEEVVPMEAEVPHNLPVASPTAPSGSLAEAILAGNVKVAMQLIDNRPMVALATATADIDAAYRLKRGLLNGRTKVSELLKQETEKYSVQQLEAVIKALTSAIDGTYTEELSAVKTSIMKAVKELHG